MLPSTPNVSAVYSGKDGIFRFLHTLSHYFSEEKKKVVLYYHFMIYIRNTPDHNKSNKIEIKIVEGKITNKKRALCKLGNLTSAMALTRKFGASGYIMELTISSPW